MLDSPRGLTLCNQSRLVFYGNAKLSRAPRRPQTTPDAWSELTTCKQPAAFWRSGKFRKARKRSTLNASEEITMCDESHAIQRPVKPGSTWRSGISKWEGIVLAILMHCGVINTNGTIAIGGDNIVAPSFLLAGDITFWTLAIGTLPGAMIRAIIITIRTDRSILTAICCPIRSSRMFKQCCKMRVTTPVQ